MPTVELIYEKTCPNIGSARKRLLEAFSVSGMAPVWSEWEISDPKTPIYLRPYGSPTILVDGKDVMGLSVEEASSCCRIYSSGGGEQGTPPLDQVVSALTEGTEPPNWRRPLKLNAAMVPSIGAALLPKLTCPACWPAYGGLLSSLGIGFVNYTPYLLPLTGIFLAIAVIALAYRAPTRRGYGPFGLGVVGAVIVMAGKFGFDSDPAMWGGLGVLVAASLWNTWPMQGSAQPGQADDCPACAGNKGEYVPS